MLGLLGGMLTSGCQVEEVQKENVQEENVQEETVARRPNLILLTMDTLRFDHLGSYGYARPTSPQIDAFAEEALVFENAFAHAPTTWSSMASLLSGFLPHETKVILDIPMSAEVPSLAPFLRAQGFDTMAVVSNFVLRAGKGYERGFRVFDAQMGEQEAVRGLPERTAVHTTNRAIELLREAEGEPFFLWVHYQDPHGPYTPPPAYADLFVDSRGAKPENQLELNRINSGRGGIPAYQQLQGERDAGFYVSRYDAEIRYLDTEVGRLFDSLKELGLYDDALIVLTSDHGESMGEHGFYFSHGESLYGSLMRVPLILRHGDRLRGRSEAFVQHIDLLPTVFGALGIDPDRRLRGRDLRAEDLSDSDVFGAMIALGSPVPDFDTFLIRDGWKLISTRVAAGQSGSELQLFDLRNDPREERDHARDPAQQGRVEEMRAALSGVKAEDRLGLARDLFPGRKPMSPEDRKALKALGYID